MSGVRADVRLVELGLAPSREKARTLIMAGEVFIDTLRIDKPGTAVPEDAVAYRKGTGNTVCEPRRIEAR